MQINNNVIYPSNAKYRQDKKTIKKQSCSNFDDSARSNICKTPSNKLLQAYFCKNKNYKIKQIFSVPYIGKGVIYELKNGHQIVIINKKGPTTINTFVKTGFQNDPERKEHSNHFLEHRIYNNDNQTEYGKFSEFCSEHGIEAGATTHENYTNYLMKYAYNDKETMSKLIKVQSQLLQNLNVTAEEVEKERKIILSEYGQRQQYEQESNEIDRVDKVDLFIKNLFNIDSNNFITIGSPQTIKNITINDLKNTHNKSYTNNNMVTAIVGDVNADEIIEMMNQNFDKPNLPNTIESKREFDLTKPIQKSKRIDLIVPAEDDKNVQVKIGFVGPKPNNKKDNFLAIALKNYINGCDSRRIDKVLKPFDANIEMTARNISINPDDPKVLEFKSFFTPAKKEEGIKAIYQILFDLSQNPLSDKELQIMKASMKDDFLSINEDSEALSNIAGESIIQNSSNISEDFRILDKFTEKDLQDFAKKYIDLNKAMIMTVLPKKETLPQKIIKNKQKWNNSEQNTLKNVSFGSTKNNIDMSEVKEYKLPNNLDFIVDTSSGITKTAFNLEFNSNDITKSKPGTATILSYMLTNGSRRFTKEQFQDFQKANGIEIFCNGSSKQNNLNIKAQCVPEKTITMINLMKEQLLSPNFSEKNFESTKEILKKYYEMNLRDDSFTNAVHNELYKNDPLYESKEDVLKCIDSITLNDVINLYNQIIPKAQGQAILTVPKEVFETNKQNIFKTLSTDFPLLQNKEYINHSKNIDSKPIQQTKILTTERTDNEGMADIKQYFEITNIKNVKDQAACKLLNKLLDTRVYKEVREKQGLAYSVNTAYSQDDKHAIFFLTAITPTSKELNGNSSNITKILESFKSNINNFEQTLIPKKELEQAKTALKNELMFNFEHSFDKNQSLLSCTHSVYGINYINEYIKAIDNMTEQDIQTATKLFLTKPSIISVKADKDVLEANKSYLSSLGAKVAL